MNFGYLVMKLQNFKSIDVKLLELEPRVFHSFDIKIVSRKKAFKRFLRSLKPTSGEIFLFQNEISQFFIRYFKALPLVYTYD